MESEWFDALSRSVATAGSRRRVFGLLSALPIAVVLLGCADTAATPQRRNQRHHARPQQRQTQSRHRHKHRHDAHDEACIPTGQRCPSKKPRGKHGKKLSCAQCCQGSSHREADGRQYCGCLPNGETCRPETASCCSGFCDGTTCAAAPCSATHPCPQCQTCNSSAGVCDAVANGTTCDDGNPCTQNDTCQGGVCVAGSALPDGTSCGSGQRCCGGSCETCCGDVDCAGTPTTPICSAAHTCVACTSSSQCSAGQICLLDGSCHVCDVSCPSGNPVTCGNDLQAAITAGGTHYVCPGRYRPPIATGFQTEIVGVTLFGAGEGTDPTTATILDANGTGRVLTIVFSVGEVILQRVRLTGGKLFDFGAGILLQDTTLRMTECTVAGNTAQDASGGGLAADQGGSTLEMTRCTVRDNRATSTGIGGGIYSRGTTTLTDCLIENNRSDSSGGGILVFNGTTTLLGTTTVQGNFVSPVPFMSGGGISVSGVGRLIIAETCRVTHNTAPTGRGGGIFNRGMVTLQGADPSPIVVENCQDNCAGPTGVAKCSPATFAGPCP